jgi:hypothetical protein
MPDRVRLLCMPAQPYYTMDEQAFELDEQAFEQFRANLDKMNTYFMSDVRVSGSRACEKCLADASGGTTSSLWAQQPASEAEVQGPTAGA